MAHILQIPISFDFRLSQVAWAQVHARITGWWKRHDGTIDSDNLTAEIDEPPMEKESIRFPLEDLPPGEWDRCVEVPIDESFDAEIELICSEFQPQLLVCEAGRYLSDSEFNKLRPGDAWEMREEFLRVEADGTSSVEFLEKWGRWTAARWVALGEILSLQAAVREALTSAPTKWFTRPFSALSVRRHRPEYPFFMLPTNECRSAICMTVTIDLLRRVKFKVCARGDCGQPFPVTSKHDRKYCSQYCGHLDSVRRNRKLG